MKSIVHESFHHISKTIYQEIDNIINTINNTLVTFGILVEKFLNLYACIFATIKNHQIITKTKVYIHKYIKVIVLYIN